MPQRSHSHLLQKMLFQYIFLLLLPCVLFSAVYIYTAQSYLVEEYNGLEQQTLSQYCTDIESELESFNHVYTQISQHYNLLRFLNGQIQSTTDQLSIYQQEFSDMFAYSKNYSPYIEDIQVYILRNDLLNLGGYFKSMQDMEPEYNNTDTTYGSWYYDITNNALIYRHTLWSPAIVAELGVLELTCSPELATDRLLSLSESVGQNVCLQLNHQWYELTSDGLTPLEDYEVPDRSLLGEIKGLSLQVSLKPDTPNIAELFTSNTFIITTFLFFAGIILFSIIFFLSVSRLSLRIVSFSKHISNSYDTAPDLFEDQGHDEFSLLVENFNQMLIHNQQLVYQVNLDQLRQKELVYKTLQAQIDPHFIYNTLESIRMMAELHNETEISDMIFSLSSLMHYTFSVHDKETTLASELNLVEQYLKIHKIRMEDRLSYQITCPDFLKTVPIPQFTIQPLVENAIRYNKSMTHTLLLIITVQKESECITITVEDNGVGLNDSRQEQINLLLSSGKSLSGISSGTGIGLDSINNRMRYLHPNDFSMRLSSPISGQGLRISLIWHLNEKTPDHNPRQEGC